MGKIFGIISVDETGTILTEDIFQIITYITLTALDSLSKIVWCLY